MSQEAVAQALGLTPGAVSKWLTDKGKNAPSLQDLARTVALCPGGSMDLLFGLDSKQAAEIAALRAELEQIGQRSRGALERFDDLAEQVGVQEDRLGRLPRGRRARQPQ